MLINGAVSTFTSRCGSYGANTLSGVGHLVPGTGLSTSHTNFCSCDLHKENTEAPEVTPLLKAKFLAGGKAGRQPESDFNDLGLTTAQSCALTTGMPSEKRVSLGDSVVAQTSQSARTRTRQSTPLPTWAVWCRPLLLGYSPSGTSLHCTLGAAVT